MQGGSLSLQMIVSCRIEFSFKDIHNRFVESRNLLADVKIRKTFLTIKKFNGWFNKINICLLVVLD